VVDDHRESGMKYRITTDHVIDASGVEDALRNFATVLMKCARGHSENPRDELNFSAESGGTLAVRPVKED
jgi:hypothetical protein